MPLNLAHFSNRQPPCLISLFLLMGYRAHQDACGCDYITFINISSYDHCHIKAEDIEKYLNSRFIVICKLHYSPIEITFGMGVKEYCHKMFI